MSLAAFRSEVSPMVRLAAPVVVAELGWMAMSVADTIMVGPLGAEAIGAVSLGGILFFTLAIFGLGVLLGLDTLVSQSFGAGDLTGCHRSLLHGIYVSLFLSPLLMGVTWLAIPTMSRWGIHPDVLRQAVPFLKALLWSMLPLLLYGCFRRYLQGMSLVKPVMFALVTANLVNVAGNWVLIYGHLGAPAMGVVGSAWATGAARVYMAAVLAGYALWHARRHGTGLLDASLALDPARLRRLLGLGVPAALQMTLEAGAFAAATALAGRLVPAALAAHQIALVVASCTFMVPLGIASAGAVRVGQALGRRDPDGAARAGWTAIALGAGFMALAAVSFVVAPRPLLRIFTDDPAVIHAGVGLLFVAALFQLFDGIQVVATGTLRGAAETRTPMICNLVAYYVVGLPVGYALCFSAGWGIIGLWTGLSVGLIGCGIVLLRVWAAKVRSFQIAPASAAGALARLRPDLGG